MILIRWTQKSLQMMITVFLRLFPFFFLGLIVLKSVVVKKLDTGCLWQQH